MEEQRQMLEYYAQLAAKRAEEELKQQVQEVELQIKREEEEKKR